MSVPGPVLGPCESWLTGAEVAACCSVGESSDDSIFDEVAIMASQLLYELSGRQFSGICESVVRPCGMACGCWIPDRRLEAAWAWMDGIGGWGWWSEEYGRLGCLPVSKITLAGYPVREIGDVKINGQVIDPSAYRLDRWRYLVRLDDPGPPLVRNRWPACQNLSLDDDQDGTFSVAYSHGVDPPLLGIQAAAELACQLYAACPGGSGDCSLPVGTVRVERQGVTIDREQLLNLFKGGTSGLVLVDAFIAGYGRGGKRPAAVWSPDVAPFPRRVT